MPIGDFEREVLRLIAANRHPASFVGGTTVLNQSAGTSRSSEVVLRKHQPLSPEQAAALLERSRTQSAPTPEDEAAVAQVMARSRAGHALGAHGQGAPTVPFIPAWGQAPGTGR